MHQQVVSGIVEVCHVFRPLEVTTPERRVVGTDAADTCRIQHGYAIGLADLPDEAQGERKSVSRHIPWSDPGNPGLGMGGLQIFQEPVHS